MHRPYSRSGAGIFLAIGLAAVPAARAQVTEAWVAAADFDGASEQGESIAVDGTGNVVVSGSTAFPLMKADVAIVKHAPDGTILWKRRLDGGIGGSDSSSRVAFDASGNVIATWTTVDSAENLVIVTAKLDPNGEQLWRQSFRHLGATQTTMIGLAVDAAGDVIVTGWAYTPVKAPSGAKIVGVVVAYDPDGAVAWSDVVDDGKTQAFLQGVAVDPASGAIFVAGYGAGRTPTVIMARYDADGRRRWIKHFDQPLVIDTGRYIAIDSAGHVVVAGRSGENDILVLEADGDKGRLRWTRVFDRDGRIDVPNGVGVDAAGNVYVAATSAAGSSDIDRVTVKYSPTGELEWSAVYDRAGLDDHAEAIAVDAAGNAYVTGWSTVADGPYFDVDFVTSRYDTSGNLVWTAIHDSSPNPDAIDRAYAIALGPGSGVVVTGAGLGDGTADVTTVHYVEP